MPKSNSDSNSSMLQPNKNNQLTIYPMPLAGPDMMQLDQKSPSASPITNNNTQNGGSSKSEFFIFTSKKLQDELEKLGRAIKHHEENIKSLKTQRNNLDESILDKQVVLGKFHSSTVPKTEHEEKSEAQNEEKTMKQILQHEKSAAAVFCLLKARHGSQASNLTFMKDVLGVVAMLGKVDDDNLSRIVSEYLGLENMLAIVCRTYEGVKALETYDMGTSINKGSALHGLGASIGRPLDGRFLVICLETLRPYIGEFVPNDPQKRLDLVKPRLPNGESPPGFLGFAVNMIDIDSTNLFYMTSSGYGLRETLFYHLFSRLQVYNTRANMLRACPCISDGALSLDGGMIRTTGVYSLGNRMDLDLIFSRSSGMSNLPDNYFETENKIRELNWRKDRMTDDIRREETMLTYVKQSFGAKKQELIKFLAENSTCMTQQQVQVSQERLTRR